jgi:hypothetical protein
MPVFQRNVLSLLSALKMEALCFSKMLASADELHSIRIQKNIIILIAMKTSNLGDFELAVTKKRNNT